MSANQTRHLTGITLVALLFSLGLTRAQHAPFTLEQIMSAPFPEGLTAAPTGGAVAWMFNARGVRNIWATQPPSYQARAITAYAEDDGQEIGDLAWTPEGKAMVYTRGGDMEMGREYPNPRSFPQGVEQDVWMIALAGGQPKRLGEGHSPAVSPKGDSVAFIYKSQVWLARIDGSEKAAQLIHSKGDTQPPLRWSPDGGKLAFVSSRGDHSLIGVYDFAVKTLRYLDPSVDRDLVPAWSPDGEQVAFIRIPASKEAVAFGPKRTDQPWSIRVADVASGLGRQVWVAQEGRGSVFRGVAADNQLLWASGDQLVFPWERDGWTHLYAVSARIPKTSLAMGAEQASNQAALLTSGDFEVEHVSLTADRKEILFSSNQDDIERRHIWRVAVSASQPTSVTTGKGSEWSPVVTSDGQAIAMLRSDARRPARPAILVGPGEVRDLSPDAIPPDFPNEQLLEPEQVIFSVADGMPIHGQLFVPKNTGGGERRPAVVFFPRRLAPPDAAGLALHVLLPQRLRPEPVPGQPRLRGVVGELSQRHRLRHGVPRGAQLRRDGRQRIQ